MFKRFMYSFWLPAARVRVPGGSPFSQLQRCEKDNFTFVKATKTFTIIGPELRLAPVLRSS